LTDLLVKLLKDTDGEVRGSAAFALGTMQAIEHTPELAKLLKDTDSNVRWRVVDALASMRAQDQVPEILNLLNDPDRDVRISVAEALATMKAKDTASDLARLLADPDGRLRNTAATALAAMGPFNKNIILPLSDGYYFDHGQQGKIRFLSYYLTGGDAAAQLVIHQTMLQPGQEPVALSSIEDARRTLRAFPDVMSDRHMKGNLGSGDDTGKQIVRIGQRVARKVVTRRSGTSSLVELQNGNY
jgi:HEAT repeat protein